MSGQKKEQKRRSKLIATIDSLARRPLRPEEREALSRPRPVKKGWNRKMDKGKKRNEPSRKCRWWTRIEGKNPQTGAPVDRYDCSIAWLPMVVYLTLYSPAPFAKGIDLVKVFISKLQIR